MLRGLLFLFLSALFLLAACTSAGDEIAATAAAETIAAGIAQTSVAMQTVAAETETARQAELDLAVGTSVAATAEAVAIQTAVVATQEAAFTPTPPPSCAAVSQNYLIDVVPEMERWVDALKVAKSTARISLAGPLSDLQAIRRDVAVLDPPTCIADAHNALIRHMDHSIESFLLFMQKAPQIQIDSEIEEANKAMETFNRDLEAIRDSNE